MINIVTARQPIFNLDMNVVAYELLYCLESEVPQDKATANTLLNLFADIGFERISRNLPVFINFDFELLSSELPEVLKSNNIVLELTDNAEWDFETIDLLRKLKAQGYTLSVEDFTLSQDNLAIINSVDYIKFNTHNSNTVTIYEQFQALDNITAKIIASKIDSYEEFKSYEKLGFEYFQGNFFCKPKTIVGTTIPASKIAVINLVAELQKPDADIDSIAKTIESDQGLSYKLLKIINSASMGLSREISSIKDAIVLIGLNEIKNWASLLVISGSSDKPTELIKQTILRAQTCAKLGASLVPSRSSEFFLVGLLSTLDALLDQDMVRILSSLPLSSEVTNALLDYEGVLGKVLESVIQYEQANINKIDPAIKKLNMSESYMDSVEWAENTLRSIQ